MAMQSEIDGQASPSIGLLSIPTGAPHTSGPCAGTRWGADALGTDAVLAIS